MSAAARRLYDAGMQSYATRDYVAAAQSFAQAYAIDPQREILFAQAQATRLGGDCPAAVPLYRRFLATDPPARQVDATRIALARCETAAAASPDAGSPAAPPPLPGAVPAPTRSAEEARPSSARATAAAAGPRAAGSASDSRPPGADVHGADLRAPGPDMPTPASGSPAVGVAPSDPFGRSPAIPSAPAQSSRALDRARAADGVASSVASSPTPAPVSLAHRWYRDSVAGSLAAAAVAAAGGALAFTIAARHANSTADTNAAYDVYSHGRAVAERRNRWAVASGLVAAALSLGAAGRYAWVAWRGDGALAGAGLRF